MKKYSITALFLVIPLVSFAQYAGNDVWSLWGYVFHLIERLTQIAWICTVMIFLFGLVQFLQKADSPAEQTKAKELMKGSIIAFFIAVSFWGLVTFAISSFNLIPDENTTTITTVTSRG